MSFPRVKNHLGGDINRYSQAAHRDSPVGPPQLLVALFRNGKGDPAWCAAPKSAGPSLGFHRYFEPYIGDL